MVRLVLFLRTSILMLLAEVSGLLSLYQVIPGGGDPETVPSRTSLSPALIILPWTGEMNLGSVALLVTVWV